MSIAEEVKIMAKNPQQLKIESPGNYFILFFFWYFFWIPQEIGSGKIEKKILILINFSHCWSNASSRTRDFAIQNFNRTFFFLQWINAFNAMLIQLLINIKLVNIKSTLNSFDNSFVCIVFERRRLPGCVCPSCRRGKTRRGAILYFLIIF